MARLRHSWKSYYGNQNFIFIHHLYRIARWTPASIGNLYATFGSYRRYGKILDILQSVPQVDEKLKNSCLVPSKGDVDIKGYLLIIHPDVMWWFERCWNENFTWAKSGISRMSGSGNHNCFAIIDEFYSVSDGAIFIDGKDIKDYNVSSLRNCVLPYSSSEVILFGGTIRENIAYGKPNASEQTSSKAAEYSNCLEFIQSFPEGFETIVGERGVLWRGQRIAIARAILKDPNYSDIGWGYFILGCRVPRNCRKL